MKRALPELLDGPLVSQMLAHHEQHFGKVQIVDPESGSVALHIGKRRVASLLSSDEGPALDALA